MNRGTTHAYYEQALLWDRVGPEDAARTERMVQMIPEDVKTVVDLGCGAGLLVQMLNHSGSKKAIGLDRSRSALRKVGGNVVVGDIRSTPFEDRSFDMAVCSEVLEHLSVDDFERAIEELRRLAKKWLFVTVPYKEVLEVHFSKCADCGCVYHAHHHVRSFDVDKLIAYFPDFAMEASETFGWVEWIGKLEAKIWHGIGGHWIATETGLCPQCESRNKVVPNRGMRDLLGLALARVIRLFHPSKKPRWMLVLMRRKPLVS